MEIIVVERGRFDDLFQQTLHKLELEQFVTPHVARSPEHVQLTTDMHRLFHYEVCQLKAALVKAGI